MMNFAHFDDDVSDDVERDGPRCDANKAQTALWAA